MSNTNLDLALQLRAKDYASKVIKSMTDNVKKSSQEIEIQSKKTAQIEQKELQKTARITEQSYRQASQMARAAASARQSLGVRSERAIQQEIARTRNEYARLKQSGLATSRELGQAHAAMTAKIKALNAEMGKVGAGQRLANIGRGVAGVAAGITAGAMVLREPVRKEMSYDRQLAMVSNTAFSERDAAGRIAGKKELHEAVKSAVATGGGTKEQALGALDKLLASGSVSAETAMKLLPTLQKGAVATGASTEDLAAIAISSMQQFGIDENDIGKVLDMAVAAGQAGNFELADMARWLPQQMAAAKQTGLTGLEGFQTLLVANQQARVTAGTSDEAGNNLVNLLAKITSKETNERFKNYEYTDKNGKKHDGIDFVKSMEAYKSKGQDSLQAFMSIMDDVVGSDDKYKSLQKKLKTAKGAEQAELLKQMTDLVEGTAIGQIISDRQALMALLGIRNNVQLGKEVSDKVANSNGAVETSHQVVRDTNDYKVEDLKATAEFAQMESLKGFNNTLGNVSQTLAEYGKEYPNLTRALAGAGTAIGAFSAAAFAAAGSMAFLGGGKGGLVGNLAKSTIGRTAAAAVTTGARQVATSAMGVATSPLAVGAGALLYSSSLNADETDKVADLYASGQYKSFSADEIKAYQAQKEQHTNPANRYTRPSYQGLTNQNLGKPSMLASGGASLADIDFSPLQQSQQQAMGQFSTTLTADINALGQTITAGLISAIQAQTSTIQLHSVLEMDGRAVAENTSEQQYQMFKRGG